MPKLTSQLLRHQPNAKVTRLQLLQTLLAPPASQGETNACSPCPLVRSHCTTPHLHRCSRGRCSLVPGRQAAEASNTNTVQPSFALVLDCRASEARTAPLKIKCLEALSRESVRLANAVFDWAIPSDQRSAAVAGNEADSIVRDVLHISET